MDLRELQKAYLDNLRQVTEEKLEIGSLIRTIISVDEGLVFKDGRKQKPKKLVIIGVDKLKKVCYGFVLVNTKKSPKSAYSASFLSAQYQTFKAFLMFSKQPRLLRTRKKSDSVLFSKVFVIMMYYERWG